MVCAERGEGGGWGENRGVRHLGSTTEPTVKARHR
jgi:hypothetical protein